MASVQLESRAAPKLEKFDLLSDDLIKQIACEHLSWPEAASFLSVNRRVKRCKKDTLECKWFQLHKEMRCALQMLCPNGAVERNPSFKSEEWTTQKISALSLAFQDRLVEALAPLPEIPQMPKLIGLRRAWKTAVQVVTHFKQAVERIEEEARQRRYWKGNWSKITHALDPLLTEPDFLHGPIALAQQIQRRPLKEAVLEHLVKRCVARSDFIAADSIQESILPSRGSIQRIVALEFLKPEHFNPAEAERRARLIQNETFRVWTFVEIAKVFLTPEHFNLAEADRIASLISNDWLLEEIAEVFLTSEHFNPAIAEQKALLISDKYARSRTLGKIAKAHLTPERFHPKEVKRIARMIPTDYTSPHHELLEMLAGVLLTPEHFDLAKAERIAQSIQHVNLRSRILIAIAKVFLTPEHFDLDKAEQKVQEIPSNFYRNRLQEKIAQVFLTPEYFNPAIAEQKTFLIPDRSIRCKLLEQITSVFLTPEYLNRAEVARIACAIQEEALQIQNDVDRSRAFESLARMFLAQNDLAKAEKIALLIPIQWRKSIELEQIAEKYLMQDLAAAERVTQSIPSEEIRSSLLAKIVEIHLEPAHLNLIEAERIAQSIPTETEHSKYLRRIAYHYLSPKYLDLAAAERIAALIHNRHDRSKILARTLRLSLKSCNLAAIEERADAIEERPQRTRILSAIVDALLASDDLAEAERVAKKIEHPHFSSAHLRQIVERWLQRHNLSEAKRLLALIPDDRQRHKAWKAVQTHLTFLQRNAK